jgi:hypothetical protein
MTPDDHFIFVETMRRYGGGFCKKLADAYSVADLSNKAKILNTWPELYEQYGPGSRFAQARIAELQNV